MRKPIRARLRERIQQRGTKACWPWIARTSSHGYGRVSYAGRDQLAHRVLWLVTRGPLDKGQCVLHRCDNPGCCNPAHLFIGTQADNVKDMWAKSRGPSGNKNGAHRHPDRMPRGETHGCAKLTENAVRQIRSLLNCGKSQHAIAADFAVSQALISMIHTRQVWRHLP